MSSTLFERRKVQLDGSQQRDEPALRHPAVDGLTREPSDHDVICRPDVRWCLGCAQFLNDERVGSLPGPPSLH